MLYWLLRPITGIALRWFYSRVDVDGLERVPADAPVLLAVNHPNALVDALVVAWMLPRRIALTAKATLFSNPLLAAVFRAVGVVPLIRAKDIAGQTPVDPARNAKAFAELNAALRRRRPVLIFPEGITGDHTTLAPLKTGAARIALQARDAGLRGVRIVPIGLTFERKDTPRTRVFAQVGEPIDVDAFVESGSADAPALTADIEERLRAVTLNFESAEDAARATALASSFARLLRGAKEIPQVYRPVAPLGEQVAIARRLESLRLRLAGVAEVVRSRVDDLLSRLELFRVELSERQLAIEDVEIDRDLRAGTVFVARELPVFVFAGPFALWGWLNHWLPFNLSQGVAHRGVQSATDPAMRAIVGGLALVLLFYGVQASLVYAVFGALAAVIYVVSLPIAADVNFHLRARLDRAMRRARAYFTFRRDPELQARLTSELRWLRNEATAIDALVSPRRHDFDVDSDSDHAGTRNSAPEP